MRGGEGGHTPREPTKQLFPNGHVKRGRRYGYSRRGRACKCSFYLAAKIASRAGSTCHIHTWLYRAFFASAMEEEILGWERVESVVNCSSLGKFIPHRACARLLLKHEKEYLPLREIKVENIRE